MHHHRLVACLVIVAACGDTAALSTAPDAAAGPAAPPDAAPPDAAPPDAAPPDGAPASGSVDRKDWTTVRGEPLQGPSVAVAPGALYALHDDGFVVQSGCGPDGDCTYAWLDDHGIETRRRERLVPTTASSVSFDGRRALLLAAADFSQCLFDNGIFRVARGRLELVDLATGDATLELEERTNFWSAPGFTVDGQWFFAAPNGDTACSASRLGYRAVTAPFAEAPGLDGDAAIAELLDAHRWLVLRGPQLGVVDPARAASFVALGDGNLEVDEAGGWVHGYEGLHTLVFTIVTLSPDGELRRTPVARDDDWFPIQAFGRWVRVCGHQDPAGFRRCRVIDVLGERAPLEVRVARAPDRPDDAQLLGGGALVFNGFAEDGGRAVLRLDLHDGGVTPVHAGDGELRPLGDGAAALLLAGDEAWLVEPHGRELLADRVRFALTPPRPLPLRDVHVRQHDTALLVVGPPEADATLYAFDLRARRLARLTDRLYPAPDFPPAADCTQPATTRHAGAVGERLTQDATHLYFVEEPGGVADPATLWIVPIDLSAPPRLLAPLADPARCQPPLVSPSGRRAALLADDAGGAARVIVGDLTR